MARPKIENMSVPLQRGFEFVDNATKMSRRVMDMVNLVGNQHTTMPLFYHVFGVLGISYAFCLFGKLAFK